MSTPATCRAFRVRLGRALEGRPLPGELHELSWHAHLATCGACRDLLEREEALEELLASLPRPNLPRALAERVLARLRRGDDSLDELLELDMAANAPSGLASRVLEAVRAARAEAAEARLDALLDLDAPLETPPALAARVLAGVHAAREEALDALLALDRGPEVPSGLAERVLEAVSAERWPAPRGVFASPRLRLVLAAAAIAAFALLPLLLEEAEVPPRSRTPELVARSEDALRAFLAQGGLELLEEPLLWAPDEDIELALATSLDPRYEVVLDYEGEGAGESGR